MSVPLRYRSRQGCTLERGFAPLRHLSVFATSYHTARPWTRPTVGAAQFLPSEAILLSLGLVDLLKKVNYRFHVKSTARIFVLGLKLIQRIQMLVGCCANILLQSLDSSELLSFSCEEAQKPKPPPLPWRCSVALPWLACSGTCL